MPQPVGGWVRVVIEKPFGRDTETSAQLSSQLEPLFNESQIFRIDHYLGKEMVQNLLTVRFANRIFSSLWNAQNIACIQITFKETIGTEGRGGYFDSFGIIRDVIQNHLTQILALVAMEKPQSLDAENIRDEKVAALRCISAVRVEDCVLGQYTASEDGSIPGYLEDPTVPKNSKCPTFAMIRLKIDNDRWDGIPFILKAGKALEDKHVGIRIQFKEETRPYGSAAQRNELVIRAQPSEAMYIKITNKVPGIMEDLRNTHQTELDLTYRARYSTQLPDAYESLINEAVLGNSTNFVRKDELDAAWRIFTPLLHKIDKGEVSVIPYKAGSRGPKEADDFSAANGFKYNPEYTWAPPSNKL
ncbi:glucose-6-phosphate 1-dehydrogenase [Strigomonas culicis]|nr:glucose-6-phosphate 1-dehydrogenase [Strigomonas culicis]|eukprot:EPY29673.1 glucose-6-phosphate 1-dehydrogenase [Strigomonas culicis]